MLTSKFDLRIASPRILIVDDDPDSIRLLIAFLRDRYPDVMIAKSGLDALDKVVKGVPDVILLDMSMPGLSGLETCRRLKADSRVAAIPVIFLTAHTSIEEKLVAFDAGAVDYITKPFSDREVLARIAVHTASRSNVAGSRSEQPGESSTSDPPITSHHDDLLLQKACEHLRANVATMPSLYEVSSSLKTASAKLEAIFQQRLGVSFFEYSLELRLSIARQLLCTTSAQIQQIAWAVGYANPGDLSRAFSKRFGMSPRAFRADSIQDKS